MLVEEKLAQKRFRSILPYLEKFLTFNASVIATSFKRSRYMHVDVHCVVCRRV